MKHVRVGLAFLWGVVTLGTACGSGAVEPAGLADPPVTVEDPKDEGEPKATPIDPFDPSTWEDLEVPELDARLTAPPGAVIEPDTIAQSGFVVTFEGRSVADVRRPNGLDPASVEGAKRQIVSSDYVGGKVEELKESDNGWTLTWSNGDPTSPVRRVWARHQLGDNAVFCETMQPSEAYQAMAQRICASIRVR